MFSLVIFHFVCPKANISEILQQGKVRRFLYDAVWKMFSYLFHCTFSRETLIKIKTDLFLCVFDWIWTWITSCRCQKQLHEFVKAKTPGLKLFIPMLFCYHIFMKKPCKFLLKLYIRLFVRFLPVFSSFRIRVLYFSTFQFLSASLKKIHNCMHWSQMSGNASFPLFSCLLEVNWSMVGSIKFRVLWNVATAFFLMTTS